MSIYRTQVTNDDRCIPRTERVRVVIDGSNLLVGAEGMQRWGGEDRSDPDPIKVSEIIVGKRRRPSELVSITIVIGVIRKQVDPTRHAREMARIRGWERDSRVTVKHLPRQHDRATGANREKGTDMATGLAFLDAQAAEDTDVAVLVTGDKDFEPVIEATLNRRSGAHIELARWDCQNGPWVKGSRLWCHYLTRDDYLRSTTPRRPGTNRYCFTKPPRLRR